MSASQFEDLYRRTAPELDVYLRRRVGSAAPDLVSEVYVIAWRRRKELPKQELLRAWLFGAARRVTLTYLREHNRTLDAEYASATAPPEAENAFIETRRAAVHAALQNLSEIDRELIQLTEWESLSVAEAAIALDLKAGTARVRLHRARRRLASDPGLLKVIRMELGPADRSSPPHLRA